VDSGTEHLVGDEPGTVETLGDVEEQRAVGVDDLAGQPRPVGHRLIRDLGQQPGAQAPFDGTFLVVEVDGLLDQGLPGLGDRPMARSGAGFQEAEC